MRSLQLLGSTDEEKRSQSESNSVTSNMTQNFDLKIARNCLNEDPMNREIKSLAEKLKVQLDFTVPSQLLVPFAAPWFLSI